MSKKCLFLVFLLFLCRLNDMLFKDNAIFAEK